MQLANKMQSCMISIIIVTSDLARFDTSFTNHCSACDNQKSNESYFLNVNYSPKVS